MSTLASNRAPSLVTISSSRKGFYKKYDFCNCTVVPTPIKKKRTINSG
jgi:hypothetical protein